MTWITTSLTEVWKIVADCIEFITGTSGENGKPGQPILQLFLVAGLIPMGFRIFKKAKSAAKR